MLLASYQSMMMALCIYREARSGSPTAIAGVAAVIANRATDTKRRWPRTWDAVILQRGQFSSFNAGSMDAMFPVTNSPEWSAWVACCEAVDNLPHVVDPTDGAQFYVTLPYSLWPSWTAGMTVTLIDGPFTFFRQD
jgi:spore germination cell wall hydrolase CwlJ-like protein